MMKKFICLFAILLQLKFVSAYIDPGTGVAIGNSLLALIISVIGLITAFIVRVFINPIKRTLKRTWNLIKS